MNEDQKNTLRRVLLTLDGISVSGRDNLDHMLGVMLTLDQMINSLEEATENG